MAIITLIVFFLRDKVSISIKKGEIRRVAGRDDEKTVLIVLCRSDNEMTTKWDFAELPFIQYNTMMTDQKILLHL